MNSSSDNSSRWLPYVLTCALLFLFLFFIMQLDSIRSRRLHPPRATPANAPTVCIDGIRYFTTPQTEIRVTTAKIDPVTLQPERCEK